MIHVTNTLFGYNAQAARGSNFPCSGKKVAIESAYNNDYVVICVGKESVAVKLKDLSAALKNAENNAKQRIE